MWTVEAADVFSPDGAALLRAYFTEVVDRYHGRPMPASLVDQAMEDEPSDGLAAFFVARYDGAPAGCAGLTASGELTRLYIAPPFRRRGGARVLLTAVEDAARWVGEVVVPVNLSPASRHQLHVAAGLAEALGVPLSVVHAIEPVMPRIGLDLSRVEAGRRAEAALALEALMADVPATAQKAPPAAGAEAGKGGKEAKGGDKKK